MKIYTLRYRHGISSAQIENHEAVIRAMREKFIWKLNLVARLAGKKWHATVTGWIRFGVLGTGIVRAHPLRSLARSRYVCVCKQTNKRSENLQILLFIHRLDGNATLHGFHFFLVHSFILRRERAKKMPFLFWWIDNNNKMRACSQCSFNHFTHVYSVRLHSFYAPDFWTAAQKLSTPQKNIHTDAPPSPQWQI